MNINATNNAQVQQLATQQAQAQAPVQPQQSAAPDNDGDQDDGVITGSRPQGPLGNTIDVEA